VIWLPESVERTLVEKLWDLYNRNQITLEELMEYLNQLFAGEIPDILKD